MRMDNSSLGFSPINVGSEQEWVVCWNILEILGLLFLGSFLFACLKLFSMWLDGSKLSNRKHTMIRLALFAGGEAIGYLFDYRSDDGLMQLVFCGTIFTPCRASRAMYPLWTGSNMCSGNTHPC